MSGNRIGGLKAAKTNKLKYGENFYAKIGHIGGSAMNKSGGFASMKVGKDGLTGFERASVAGRKGGLASRRGKEK